MEPKKSKYDTNPLDPDVAKNTEKIWGEDSDGAGTQEMKGATRGIGPSANESARSNVYSEAPTRRYNNVPLDSSYPSVFVPPSYPSPTPHQTTVRAQGAPGIPIPTSRAIAGLGLSEKWAMVLPYAPFYIGTVVALLELFLVPRKEVRVRFHAAQGLALHIAILAIQTLFSVVGAITDSSIGGTLFKLAALAFLVVSMIRVWKGEPHRIAPLNEPAQWLNAHIEPRNKG